MDDSLKGRLKKLGLTPSQSMGQNFLIDENIAEKIVLSAEISEEDTVMEIGPGLGMLTDRLVSLSNDLILVEKDRILSNYLEDRYRTNNNVDVISGDVLEIELPTFDKIVSNLPFSISSPLTFKILEHDFKSGILTYQKEYADRLVAEPGEKDYSRLSVMAHTFARVERLFDISKDRFYPRPKVDATVVRLTPRAPDFDIQHPYIFSDVVRQLFNYRRKMIRNALKTGFGIGKIKDIPYQEKRVGNLTPEQINEIVEHVVKNDIM
ncbi:MAG: 16S rRNA (adenine(1518)-N(6)/adenine(1519)-N(6))-dimethyltransferase RsmA [Candidatus Saliniplasma sp.]